MSVYVIYYKDGAKMMRPVLSREEYIGLRDSEANRRADKKHMVQMNYSCLPNGTSPAGPLKGSTTPSNTVGMDVDLHRNAYDNDEDYQKALDAIPEKVLAKKDELGLLMLERSATKGYHLVFRRHPDLSQEENLRWASNLLGVEFDKGAKDITRVFYTPADKLLYLEDELFDPSPASLSPSPSPREGGELNTPANEAAGEYLGIPYSRIISKWWELYNDGKEPVMSNRNTLTFELAVNLRHICGFDRELMDRVIPCYDGFPQAEKMACIDSALSEKRTQMPKRLKDVLFEIRREKMKTDENTASELDGALDEALQEDANYYANRLPKMPLGVRESVEAVGPALAMPIITAICPAIGTLATGVELDVHGKRRNLNLIAYIAGDFASGKGDIDPVVEAWMAEVKTMDKMYQMQEDEWRSRKRAAKNKKEQPEEPKLPVRCLTLNNTVANLSERLANTEGKHAFSFTPEADTVAQKWKSAMSDFSVMLRQSYDGAPYEREARSADAVNVHIDKLLWNITMCGTPDALYRVVNNYTDGFQSRIAIARTPDNTFAPLNDTPYVLNERHKEKIRQVAHLLTLMKGTVVLPKLEAKGREWVENIRQETIKDYDTVRARQRFRICVTAQRMTCCLMLCKVCEQIIAKHGFAGAENRLKQNPNLWKEMLQKAQTPQLLEAYDVIADSLMENALHFFRDRIENAFQSREYAGSVSDTRVRRGKNDSIYERLDVQFTFEQAFQQSIAVKGAGVSRNSVHQMLKNWRSQRLIEPTEDKRFRKL